MAGESDSDGSLFSINLENENHDEIPNEEMVNDNEEVPVEENIVNQPVVHIPGNNQTVINIRGNNPSVVNISPHVS